ncbi:MAG: hypothetical protein JWM93_3321 [Frankiales bacterium]|nr:hypothetical protein [Frankiales bacterium]
MSGFVGMDIPAVEELGRKMQAQSVALQQAVAQVDRILHELESVWHGQRAGAFHAAWTQHHRPLLARAAEQVDGLGLSARANATEQRQASGGGGAAGQVGGAAGSAAAGHQSPARFAQRAFTQGGMVLGGVIVGVGKVSNIVRTVEAGYTKEWSSRTEHTTSVGGSTTGNVRGIPMQATGTASATTSAWADGKVTIGKDGIEASAGIGAHLQVEATGRAALGDDNFGTEANVHAKAEVGASATGTAHVGTDGATAHAHAGAMAAASVDGSVTSHIGGVDTTAGAHGYAGVGVYGDLDASVTADDVKFSASLGAALGFGGGFNVKVDVKPSQVAHNLSSFYHHPFGA